MLSLAHPGFGAFVWELWAALDGGADLLMPEHRAMGLADLAREIERSEPTAVHISAGLFRQFVPAHPDALAGGPRLVMTGGDTVAPGPFRAAADVVAGDVVACYGCTENTVFTTLYRADDGFTGQTPVPLGEPLSGTRVRVVSPDGDDVAVGEVGELLVGGDGLVAGYLNDADATVRRFAAVDGHRTLRTGDFARRVDDGTYVLVGRQDRQVQVRGFRVELAEVERQFRLVDGVADAHAVQVPSADGEAELAVLVTGRAGAAADAAAALTAVRGRVPDFMVPSRAVVVDALPLTERGKVDRRQILDLLARGAAPRAAADPDDGAEDAGAVGGAGDAADASDVSTRIEKIWQQILDLPSVPHDQSFTEAGGHSLRATQILTRVTDEFGVTVSMRRFYDDPTIAGLAACVRAESKHRDGAA